MKKTYLSVLLVMFVILMSFSALAEMKNLHSAWHEYTDVFTVDNKVFDIRLGENENSLLRVKVDNFSGFIEYRKCEDFDIYTVCYQNRSTDVAQTSISDSGKTMPGVLINISKDDLSTDLTFTPKLAKFNINEPYEVNITVKNKKPIWVDSFKYELTLPTNLSVSNLGDFTVSAPGKIALTGSMQSNSEKVFSFTVISSSPGVKRMNYTLFLSSGGVNKDTKGYFNLDSGNPYLATISITPSTQNVLSDSKLLINIKNTGNKDLELNDLKIRCYGDMRYFAGKGLSISGSDSYSIVQKETLTPGSDEEYYMIITPLSTGKFNISIYADMTYEGKQVIYSVNKTLVSSASGFTPVLDLSKDAVLAGSEVELYFEVYNSNSNSYFKNISVNISGDFVSENLYLDKLGNAESKVLLRKFIVAPYLDKDQVFKITALVDYFNQAGEKKQLNLTKNIKVTSEGSFVTVDHKITPAEVYTGQEVIIDVTVKNMKDEMFDLVVLDILPRGVEKVGGIISKNITLKGTASESVYMYKLKVPEDSDLTQFNVTSIARIYARNYETSDVSTVKVKKNLTRPSVPVVNDNNDDEDNMSGIVVKNQTGTTAKKDTAFRRFFKNVEHFFVNLFS